MKCTFMFLLVLVLIASRRLKKKKFIQFEFDQLTYIAKGAFGIIFEGKLRGQNGASFETFRGQNEVSLVVKYPLTEDVINRFNASVPQGIEYNKYATFYFQNEVYVMNHLNSHFQRFENETDLDHQAPENSQENLWNELINAIDSPFGYKLNPESDRIVLIKYDCDLLDFVYEHRNKSNFDQVGRLIQDKMIRAIFFLHLCRVLHRDIKLENFMIKVDANKVTACKDIQLDDMLKKDFYVAILDFGLSTFEERNQNAPVGTQVFMAPEVFFWVENQTDFENVYVYSKGYNLSADVYSLALALLDVESKLELRNFEFSKFNDFKNHVSKVLEKTKLEYKEVLETMLVMDPTERIKIEKVEELFRSLLEPKSYATKVKRRLGACKNVWNRFKNWWKRRRNSPRTN